MNALTPSEDALSIKLVELRVFIDDVKMDITLTDDSNPFVMQNFRKFMVEYLRTQAMNLDRG